jgi:Amt family ammonium transporter
MQAGFALVEAGYTRTKNTVNIMMKNLMDFVIATFAYWAIGYGLMFGTVGNGFFGTDNFFVSIGGADVVGLPHLAFWLFQLVFAGTASTIVSGAMAERTKFSAYLIYSLVISLLIYPIAGHWTWGSGWLWTLGDSSGLLAGGGFRDFAGSSVVHSVGGWAALIGAWLVGPRTGRFTADGKPVAMPGHSVALAFLGTLILWFGWFGFNGGSQLAIAGANADAVGLVVTNTTIGAAAGALAALLTEWGRTGKTNIGAALNGALAGLVAITAGCAYVTPGSAFIIGAVAGPLVIYGAILLEKLKIDDPVGAVPVHLVNGVWGTLAVGLFASQNGLTGLFAGGGAAQLILQLIGIAAYAIWTAGLAFVMFFAIKKINGLRVRKEEEALGLDVHEHGSEAYPLDPDGISATVSPSRVIGGAARS